MVSLRGKLLLAGPTLKDPNFDRTVVLITEHTEEGAMGLVLNRPSTTPVGAAVPDLTWVAADDDPVRCVAPTLIEEEGDAAKPVESKREELASLPEANLLSADEVATLRAIGDNTGSMTLKGAAPDHEGEPRPDRWALTPELSELAARWGIEPGRDLAAA